MSNLSLTQFLSDHRLPDSYLNLIDLYFRPLAQTVANRKKERGRPLIVGINGCQGSGKSTLADALVTLLQTEFALSAIALSIDDFYLTRSQRQNLATTVHPLLQTRGVPGTHDIALASDTIQALQQQTGKISIPRFEKATDDRMPQSQWPQVQAPVDVIILEGWCVGSKPQPSEALVEPVNTLETQEDPHGEWRRYANDALSKDYQALFNTLDYLVMLKAPAFSRVHAWRVEQEEKLRAKKIQLGESTSNLMSAEEISRFIQHYQRITEYTLEALPEKCDVVYELDQQRNIVAQE